MYRGNYMWRLVRRLGEAQQTLQGSGGAAGKTGKSNTVSFQNFMFVFAA